MKHSMSFTNGLVCWRWGAAQPALEPCSLFASAAYRTAPPWVLSTGLAV